MKTRNFLGLLMLFCTTSLIKAQSVTGQQAQATTPPPPTPYAVVAKDANSRVWQQKVYERSPSGGVITNIHSYTELASGLNHLVNGQWVESSEQIDVLPNGTAAATNGQHQAYFPGNIYQGQIKLVTPDGLQLQSRPLALSYDDGTNTVIIAELTNSDGQVLGANQVIYPNAFAGVAADLIYTYTKAGFEQDIVLREQPPTPESLGLNPGTARLQVLTEFFAPPQPRVQSTELPPQAGLTLTDETLGFGSMQMIPGRAFLLGENATEVEAKVGKQWVVLDGRQFLVEEVPVDAIAAGLATLPVPARAVQTTSSTATTRHASRHLTLPPQRLANTNPKSMPMARASVATQGLVLDYVTINSGQASYTFQGDTTYYISGGISFSGVNTFEGGTVIKYTNNASIIISSGASVNCLSSAYHPVVLTARDDNTVGETISGSTGNPTNYYAAEALFFSGGTNSLQNMRIDYAQSAILGSGTVNLTNVQMVNCQNGVTVGGNYESLNVNMRNVLMANVLTNYNLVLLYDASASIITAQNVTIADPSTAGTCSLFGLGSFKAYSMSMTNCILASMNVTNFLSQLSGGYNGFYNTAQFGSAPVTNTFYPFQTVGAGNYYLTNGCAFTNAGTTSIDGNLLAGLKQRTTHSPILYSNVTITTNLMLWPQAVRDTSGSPDLGYHYDPLDYCWNHLNFTNATLTLTNGVAIGFSGTYGLELQSGAALVSQGTPLTPNQLVGYQSVQEEPVFLGATNLGWTFVAPVASSATINCRFTDISAVAFTHDTVYFTGLTALDSLTLRDCHVSTVLIYIFDETMNSPGYIAMTNNIFWRSHLDFGIIWGGTFSINFYNNLCFGGEVDFYGSSGASWNVYDNLFDSVITAGYNINDDYNGYYNAASLEYGGNDDVGLSEDDYQAGPLGNYYYPTNDNNLQWLINAGSTTAGALGLYHYTVTTNQVIEGTNIVSIGFHYVAVDANGNPLDSNGDGIPDYLEDANGNGLDVPGQIPWDLGITSQPPSLNLVQGQTATFSVGVAGVGPFTYQWQFDSNNIPGATGSSYTKLVVMPADAGAYSVIVSNWQASVTSSNAILTVAVPLVITSQPANQTVLQGATANFSVGVSGTTPACQWFTNGVALSNSSRISGANNTNLTIASAMGSDAGSYYAVITNLANSVSSMAATLTVITPPNIVASPGSQTNVQATDTSFAVTATGTGLAYQWQFNGTNIAGATNSSYTKLVVQTNNAGIYSVVVTNIAGSVTNNATLTVIVPPFFTQQPSSVTTNQGSTALFSITAIGTTNLSYQWFANRTNAIFGATSPTLTLTNVQAVNAAGYSILVTNNVGTNFSAWAWLSVITGGTTNYGWGGGGSSPAYAPLVSMISPTNALATNAAVFLYGPPISIRATASSPYGYITNVAFYYTGTNYGTNFMLAGTAVPGANTQYALAWTNSLPGTNIIQAVAWDNSGLSTTSSVVYVIMAVPPTISAGPNTNLVWTEGSSGTNILLSGSVSSNGLPVSGVTNVQWSVASGNGGYVTIANANSLVTQATFTTNGFYVMQLQVNNGFATNTGACTVTIKRRPFVTITSPTNSTTVLNGTPIAINATATSLDSSIASVSFYTNGTFLGTAIPSAGNTYALLWSNTCNTSSWTNSLGAVATDNDGLTSTSTVSVIVLPNEAVSMVSPINQTLLEWSNITVSATATNYNPSASISWVEFFANGTNSLGLAITPNNGLYQITWTPAVSGTNILTAIAVNTQGSNVWSAPVTNYVRNLPTVAITNPVTGSVFGPSPVNMTIQATASADRATITSVTFYQGTTALGTNTSSPYTFTWSSVTNGTYTVTAKATDSTGATGVSYPIKVTVNPVDQPPQVNAGPNQLTNLPTAQLYGSATDDGLPNNYLAVTWSRISGPGTVTFGNSNQPVTTATFNTNGTNVLQLTATDGQLTATSSVTICVFSNSPPVVNAGPNQTNICPVEATNFVIHLTPVTTFTNSVDNIVSGIGIDYYIPSNDIMYSLYYTNTSQIFEMVSPVNGASIPFTSSGMTNLPPQEMFATVKDKLGGFTPGEILTGNNNPGEIVRIRPDGSFVGTNGLNGDAWVVLSNSVVGKEMGVLNIAGNNSIDVGAIYVDRTGIFGGDLIVAVVNPSAQSYVDVWRINSAGKSTLLAQVAEVPDIWYCPVITLPNNPEEYGPWAGKILLGYMGGNYAPGVPPSFHTVDTNGFVVEYDGFQGSTISIIPPNENLYAVDTWNNVIWGAPASAFQGMTGDLLITESIAADGDGGNCMYSIRWNGQAFVKSMVAVAGSSESGYNWSQVAFAPTGATNVPPSPYSVQLNGSVTDDGLIWSNTINTWVEVGGPGPVTFADATQPNTVASFAAPGTYVLRLIANDGEYTVSSNVTIQIVQNQAPVVNPGTNQNILTTSTTLSGNVTDDGWPSNRMTIVWSQASGPGTANFSWQTNTTTTNNFNAANSVSFTANGTYILQLTASDGQATVSTNVIINVTTPQLTLTPAYSGPFSEGAIQTLTAMLVNTNGVAISNASVQFIVNGVDLVTNSVTTGTNGVAQFTFTNSTMPGRDLIQAYFTNGSQVVSSQPAVIDWAINLNCGDYDDGFLTNGLSTAMPGNDLRYANYFIYTNGQAGATLTMDFIGLDENFEFAPMLLFLKNSSNQVLTFAAADSAYYDQTFETPGTYYCGPLVYTLPAAGNYIFELTTVQTNEYDDFYAVQFSCSPANPVIDVLLNSTNVPTGTTLVFGPTLTNVPVTLSLTITNPGYTDLLLGSPQTTNGDFEASLGTSDVPTNSSTTLTITFNAVSNETSVGTLVITNNTGTPYALTLIGSAFPPGSYPAIQMVSPVNNETYYAPAVIPVMAAVQAGSYPVSYVSFQASYLNFFLTNGPGIISLGIISNAPYSMTWLDVPNSDYFISATAVDSVGRSTTSPAVLVHVFPSQNETPPVAVNDQYTVQANSVNNILYTLNNDYDTNSNSSLSIVATTSPQFGTATVINNGQAISYTPPLGVRGYDNFTYEITDGLGGTAWASVAINISGSVGPSVIITNPPNQFSTNAGFMVPLVAYVAPSQNIAKVDFYLGESLVGEATNGVNGFYTNYWTAACAYGNCVCPFAASATDIFGQIGTSPQISIIVNQSTNVGVLTASLDSIVDAKGTNSLNPANLATIREGLFNVYGHASNSLGSSVSWQLGVYDLNGTLVRDLTPNPNTDGYNTTSITSSTNLASCDLTTVMNGVYILRLTVMSPNQMTDTDVQFRLESNLKVGQFGFSQQDLVIPVNGIPLNVTRTYNSLNSDQGDFGYGWTYSLSDMDVSIDETRQNVADFDGQVFNERTGGSYDVTLTLPNGQRTTFYYSTIQTGITTFQGQWQAAPGVTATLAQQGTATLYDFSGFVSTYLPYWTSSYSQEVPFDNFDFPGFILTTQDGTQYVISRQDLGLHFINDGGDGYYVHAYGNAYLSQIIELNQDTITVNSNSIVHTYANGATNQIVFQRNTKGLIAAISDPDGLNSSGSPTGPAAVVYQYDSNNNLINVLNLVNRSGSGTYVTNSYSYTNVNYPHYITGIFNADGTQVAKNFYDSNGKLTAVQDANGIFTQFIHNLTNDMDVVIDRLGNTNIYVYDPRGNVIAQTNALGQVSVMAYDDNNNKTNEITYLGTQPYATNSYAYDLNLNEVTTSTDPLGHVNSFIYNDNNGELLTSTDARGYSTTYNYDTYGNLTNTVDALGDTTVNFYTGSLLSGTQDALGNITTNYYGSSDNLIATAMLSASGAILSSNTYAYDANGNRTNSVVWRRNASGTWVGATTVYIYDAQNRVIQTIDPDGGTNTVVYNAVGKQQATIDPLGNTMTNAYDAQGRLIQTTYADGTSETSAYDANGNRTNSVDRAGRITVYAYDALNRLTNTTYADNTANSTIYDGVGRVAQTIDARGTITAFNYDTAGRRLTVTNAFGITGIQNVSSNGYDANGNQITFTDANNHTTTNVFDSLNRQFQVHYPNGTSVVTGYDRDGRRVSVKNQDLLTTLFGYDGAGRLTAVTNALSQVTRYQYDEAGNQTAQMDALNRTNTYVYDSMGRRINHIMPGGQNEGFLYDPAGNLLYSTNFNGATITNRYDVMNRLTNRASGNGYQVSYSYTSTGQRQSMIDASGTNNYGYDNRDRLLLKTVNWIGGPTISLNYRYDANGNVTNLWSSTANGVTNIYQYDAMNRLTNVLANGSAAASYGFDLVGNLQSMRYGNGVTNLNQYDSLNRLTNGVWKLNTSTLASFYYKLGLTGNRTNLIESVNTISRTNIWSYDKLYRLTNEVIKTTSTNTLGYGYDLVGNRTNRTVAGGLSLTNQAFIFNTNDWLASDQYDNNGNTTNSSGNLYQYDVMNHITNMNNTVFITYDGDGNRVSKTNTATGIMTYYLVDDRNPSGYAQVVEEWASTGTPALSRVYNYGLELISQRQPNASTNYFILDGHGSTRMLTDIGGNFVNAFTYDAYGTLIASNSAPQTAYLYCGQQLDSDLGLYYNRARYLNPNTGRFWSGDSTDGDNEDPLSLHKYLYAQDNPVDNVDPSGNDDVNVASVTAAAGIGGTIDASIATVTVTAQTAAEGTAIAAEATEVTETAVAAGETATAAEETVAKTTLRMLGKTVRGIIEQAKKIMNLAKESPVKVVPMPKSVIPSVCANITTGLLRGQPWELKRVNAEQTVINRREATGLLGPAGVGKSWDEYPFASGKDPRTMPLPATVAPVPWWENSVQGGIIAGCYKIEGIKVGTPYTVIVIP